MKVKITMLNVKDGDAIIIELTKQSKSLVILIDGGQPVYYRKKLKPKLEQILKIHNKKAPDIVVCTHYDSDHIGGLIPLIKDYIADIKQVWIHKTPDLLASFIENTAVLKEEIFSVAFDDHIKNIAEIKSINEFISENNFKEKANFVIQSLPQLKKLISLIPRAKLKQVFYNQKPLADWPEITVVGPTKAYYKSLFPADKTFTEFILEESFQKIAPGINWVGINNDAIINPCDSLKKDSDTQLTSTNKASIIFAIDDADKRYLFTGDAGIESFKKIPNYKTKLKNLYFLKIPHHGSNNNISKELIELMQPKYAYNSGNKHQDEAVLQCFLKKLRNKKVESTKASGDLVFEN